MLLPILTMRGLIAAAMASIALGAFAQNAQPVQPPAGLKWQWMHEIVFNSTNFSSTGTDDERSLLAKIWAKELKNSTKKSPITGQLLPSFTLIGTVQYKDTTTILTMFDNAGSGCISPGNGQGMVDMYLTCPLRLIKLYPEGKFSSQDLSKNFCMLFGDDSNNPRSKNHNEYAFDMTSGIVYLRLIQYGKIVPVCNRALRIFRV